MANPEMPNPYTPSSTQVTFNDLPADCLIELYTLGGEKVRTITVSQGNGQAAWDLKNDQGEPVASGTYQYIIKNSTGQKEGKIVIIR